MGSEFAIYTKKMEANVEALDNCYDIMKKCTGRIDDVQGKLKSGNFKSICSSIKQIEEQNRNDAKSAKELKSALKKIIKKYESTEKRIVDENIDNGYEESEGEGALDYIWDALKQAVLGDFEDDTNLLGTALSVAIGFIPIVGQIADVRDLVADIYNLIDDGPETKEWVDLAFTVVGFIPGIGDFCKHGDEVADAIKGLGKNLDEILDASGDILKYGDEIADATGAVLKKGKDLLDGLENIGKNAANKLDEVFDSIVKSDSVKHIKDTVLDIMDKDIPFMKELDILGKKFEDVNVGDLVKEIAKSGADDIIGVTDGVKDWISDRIDDTKDFFSSTGAMVSGVFEAAY